MKNRKLLLYVSILLSVLFYIQSAPLYAAEMKDYCIIPPYVKREVKPNILIIMDNAQGMGDAAYSGNYNPSTTYEGYFKSNLMYTYGSNRWYPDASGIYSGNILNWVAMSKYDLLEEILVGGISVSRQTNVNTLVSMSTSWTKTLKYDNNDGLGQRKCFFIVNNANVEIKDDTGGSCGYLDTPPHPFDPVAGVIVASRDTGDKFVMNTSNDGQESDANLLGNVTKKAFSFLNYVMDFLVPDAEAAKPLAMSGGPSTLTGGTECTAYSFAISASGGTQDGYTWSIIAGSLPPGLSIDPGPFGSGVLTTTIHGTPTTSGTYNFTVQVTDSGGATDSKAYSITIADATVTIATTTMPVGTAWAWYRSPIVSSGPCTNSTTWTKTAGDLPPGLSLTKDSSCVDPSNCVFVSGTPNTSGTYTFTLQVTDSSNNSTTKDLSITINPAVSTFSIITASPLPNATAGSYYITDIATAGSFCGSCCSCPSTYSWSISGTLPDGLTFNSTSEGPCSNGDHVYITGTPTTTGTYSVTIQVTDCNSNTASKTFSLTVGSAPVPVRSTGNLNVNVCVGNYTANCNTPLNCADYPDASNPCYNYDATTDTCLETSQCILKSGIVYTLWTQARLGVQDFNKQAGEAIPNIANCIEANPGSYPDPNFLTAVENAVPIDPTTTLVNAEYTAIDYYANNTAANCDPFRSSQNCQRNFDLLITNGVGADNPPTPSGGSPSVFSDDPSGNCAVSAYKNLSLNSCYGYNNDLRASLAGRQYVSTYIVNTMGTVTTMSNGQCDPSVTPSTTGDILCQAAVTGGGSYYEVVDASALRDTLVKAFQDILKRAAAGTAASVLASGEGSGANLLQAVFYPRRKFNTVEIDWTGRLTNFWYYVDPFFNTSSIYEDNGSGSTDYFDFADDNRVTFYFDIANEKTMAHRYPPTGTLPDIAFESLNSLWESGLILWSRDLTSSPRTIKTWVDSNGDGLVDSGEFVDFSTGNASSIRPYLNLTATVPSDGTYGEGDINQDGSIDDADAGILISYIGGEDFPSRTWLRSRTVTIGSDTHVWKLGDILNSTPKISSWIPLNNYNTVYKDTSYDNYTKSSTYTGRGMVFAGGNDGMLHAFKLGKLELTWTSPSKTSTQIARMTGSDLGKEIWAYIPKNVLPYLKYIKETDYCHVYSIDLSPYVFDASIGAPGSGDISTDDKPTGGSTWRTILIGGMRYGGACKNSCSTTDCIQTPATDKGYSSYFAIDITDQNNPTLLWEFSNESLGLTTTGPAVVRIGDQAKNGKWFVVFGSGPTGTVDKTYQQFLGRSDQDLSLFVLDVKTGALLRTINTFDGSSISNAFAGSMLNSTLDADVNYQDDVVYVGYVKKYTPLIGSATWTDGGVLRLQTKEDTDVSNWEASVVMDGIGPVTSSVTKLLNKNKGNLWLFFGTGRYYFEKLDEVDDADGQRTLFGLKEPCYTSTGIDRTCKTTFSGSLTDVSTDPSADPASITNGWKINLDATGDYPYLEGTTSVTRTYRAERVITDPLATSSGLVFFTTYKPYTDVCAYGGKSFIWAVKYSTGGAPGALLKGIALLQVSTGSIEQVDLSTAFTERNLRRTSALEGVPPTAQGLSLMSTPPPVKRTIHIRER